jgi:hypothetical protein
MTDRETLDEAIDRVALQMTQAQGGDVVPVWTPAPARWTGWRIGGAVAALAIVVGLVVTSVFRVAERGDTSTIGASALVAWSPLQMPARPAYVGHSFSGANVVRSDFGTLGGHRFSGAEIARSDFGTPKGVPSVPAGEGIEPIRAPATLEVAPVSVPALSIAETEGLGPLVIPDLAAATSSESPFPREQ